MPKILITGGAGFIGSHTSLVLIEKGFDLIILDSFINSSSQSISKVENLSNSWKKINKPCIKVIKGDIRNIALLEKIFDTSIKEKNPIEGVIHFSGLKAVSESVRKPLEYWDANVNGSITLFKVMKKYNCSTLVFSSSASIYASKNFEKMTEDCIINPTNPYGHTKATIENILKNLYNSNPNNWKIISLRYFNPIGAHPSGIIGESPQGVPNNIFPYITQVAIGERKLLRIFGKDWPTKDGTGIRDYIHVMDLAEAHLFALNHLLKGKAQFKSINIGTGSGVSVLELVKTFQKINNLTINYEFTERRVGDIPFLVADNSFAKNILNWVPKRNLNEMCLDGWKWQKLNPRGYT